MVVETADCAVDEKKVVRKRRDKMVKKDCRGGSGSLSDKERSFNGPPILAGIGLFLADKAFIHCISEGFWISITFAVEYICKRS
jgi:hypothetical protein